MKLRNQGTGFGVQDFGGAGLPRLSSLLCMIREIRVIRSFSSPIRVIREIRGDSSV